MSIAFCLTGISRTCEIFNVKELVIGNIRYLEDKSFQTLSVTSEKWLNIKEVIFLRKFHLIFVTLY